MIIIWAADTNHRGCRPDDGSPGIDKAAIALDARHAHGGAVVPNWSVAISCSRWLRHNGRVPADDSDPRWGLVYDEALRALSFQQSALDNLRSRATLLTAGAALIGSVLGTPALADARSGVASVLAIAALACVLATAGIICAPWWRWRFVSSAARLTQAVELGHSLDSMRRHLAADFEKWLDSNEKRLRGLQWCFTAGLMALLMEMVAWLVQLAQLRG